MERKTTRRYYYLPTKLAKIKKTAHNVTSAEDVEQYIASERIECGIIKKKKVLQIKNNFLAKLNMYAGP